MRADRAAAQAPVVVQRSEGGTDEPPPIVARLALDYPGLRLDVDLRLPGRGFSALFGPSGSGKTSCLRAFAGLLRARGRLEVGGEVWQDDARRVSLRRTGAPSAWCSSTPRCSRT